MMIVVVFKSRDELVIGLKNGNKGMERWRAYIAEEKRESEVVVVERRLVEDVGWRPRLSR